MGFEETMAGTFVSADGVRAPMHFTVRATAKGPIAFMSGHPVALEGTVTVGGMVKNVPCSGTLEVQLARLRNKELVYRVDFEGPDGKQLSYYARKNVRLRRLLTTMTTLRGRLYKGADVLGVAELTFDLKHLPGFVGSFRLFA